MARKGEKTYPVQASKENHDIIDGIKRIMKFKNFNEVLSLLIDKAGIDKDKILHQNQNIFKK